MPAIDALMKRFGFVKLSRYGLVLTPEGRIMSLRPAILDDGLGGRIVGWRDNDLAAAELEKWEPARPAPRRAVATPPAIPAVRVTAQVPVVAAPVPVVAAPVVAAPVVTRPAAVAAPTSIVAPPPAVAEDDDEWEWTIALARARAAAEDSEQAAAAAAAPVTPPRRSRADTVPPPVAQAPVSTLAARNPMEAWPATQQLTRIDYEDYTSPSSEVVRVARLAQTPTAAPATPPHIAQIPTAAPATPPRIAQPAAARTSERPLATPIGVRKQSSPKIATIPARAPTAPIARTQPTTPTQPTAPTQPQAAAPTHAAPAVVRTAPRAQSPATIIPIPKLPSIRTITQERTTQLQPVVRPSGGEPLPPRRFPKGTGPVGTSGVRTTATPVRHPNDGDATTPALVLPAAANPVALPRLKR